MPHSFIHRLISVLCFVCFIATLNAQTVSAEEKADTTEMPRRAIGLLTSDSIIARQALQLMTNNSYAYIAIHGKSDVFKIIEGNTWKTITHKSLAKWIANERTYDNKTIVLLSCANKSSSQKLANSLAVLDKAAKRPLRKVIGWDNNVVLYANGYIRGYGACRRFSPQAGNLPLPEILLNNDIPKGKGIYPPLKTKYVVLSTSNLTQAELEDLFRTLDPSDELIPDTDEHKADRWMQYINSGGTWSFERWSPMYEANMTRARQAHEAVDDYLSTLAWNREANREYSITVTVAGSNATRRIDIAHVANRHGVEVKAYETGVVYNTDDIKREVSMDGALINQTQRWTIDWVFLNCRPSEPLRTALTNAGINIIEQ
jgi:hypothetical protein